MIKEYDLKFYDAITVADSVLYERYVDRIAQVLTDCGLFDNVVKNKPSGEGTYADYSVEAYVSDDKIVKFSLNAAVITPSGAGATTKFLNSHVLSFYYGGGVYACETIIPTSRTMYTAGIGFRYAYVTSNGIMFKFNEYSASAGTVTSWGSIIIARSNKQHPLIIAPNSGTNNIRGTTVACHSYEIIVGCYSDEEYSKSKTQYGGLPCELYNFNTTAKQTEMFPFLGYGSPNNDNTYSKYALWIPFAPTSVRNGNFQKVLVNDKAYITDGYFALRDD